jgi:photosystem II stability/assembly factor-like uncharacterized protein
MASKLFPAASTAAFSLFCSLLSVTVHAQTVDTSQLSALKWRNIGPFRGGRISAVTGAIGIPGTFYVGLPEGGIWKTTSAGQTWYPVADSIKEQCCFGAIQVAPSDPNIVYAGSGESFRGDGDGVYKSSDAGATWQHLGLEETQRIPALLVDPHDANLVLLGATGNGRMHTNQRGVFRSTDGGKTWTNPLFIDNETGIVNIAWAYDNPSVIFAMSAHRYSDPPPAPRKPVPEPMLYKSTDEGATWTKLAPKGLPKLYGRGCFAVAQHTNSQRVFLIGQFGLYRSDDGGANWRQMAKDDARIANGQGDYTCYVGVDSTNPDIVYTLATAMYRSTDGGETFVGFKGAPGGDDPQQLWIDPTNGDRILYGGDQGATVSLDAGKTWGSWYNQMTGQVYHVTTDNQWPYGVYATQQDSGTIGIRTRGNLGAITFSDWTPVPGSEFGTMIVDPLNANNMFVLNYDNSITKITYPSMQWIGVGPDLNPDLKLRGGFSRPMTFSYSNPHELIAAYNCLMTTTDGGVHWKSMSPDLTIPKNAKPTDQQFGAIESFSQSSLKPNTFWTLSNTRVMQLTTDGGATWKDVTMPDMPAFGRPMSIDSSHTDPQAAYVAIADGTGGFDTKPHFYRTHDLGKTWTEISNGIPGDLNWATVIRADTKRDGLLFAGTQKHLYVSFNDGDNWESLNLNVPTTQISDLTIKDNDLIVGTYGRGIWILDDYTPLREVTVASMAEAAHLYKPGDAIRVRRSVNSDTPAPAELMSTPNAPLGASIYYSLSAKPSSDIQMEISDSKGRVVRHYSSAPIVPYADPPSAIDPRWIRIRKPLSTDVGLNRVNWDGRYDDPPSFIHDAQDVIDASLGDTPQAIEGPLALPGEYQVKMTVDGRSYTQPVTLKNDPRSPATQAQLVAEHEMQMNYYALTTEAWDGYQQVADMRAQVAGALAAKPSDEVAKALQDFDQKLHGQGGDVVYRRRFLGLPPSTNFESLNDNLMLRLDSFDMGDMAPTDSMFSEYGASWVQTKGIADKWTDLCTKDLVVLNALLTKNNLKPIAGPATALKVPPAPAKQYMPAVKQGQAGKTGNIDPEDRERQAEGGAPDEGGEGA